MIEEKPPIIEDTGSERNELVHEGLPTTSTQVRRVVRSVAPAETKRNNFNKIALYVTLTLALGWAAYNGAKDYIPGAYDQIKQIGTDISNFLDANPNDESTTTDTALPTTTQIEATNTPSDDILPTPSAIPLNTSTLEPTAEVLQTSTPEVAGSPKGLIDSLTEILPDESACRRGNFELLVEPHSIEGVNFVLYRARGQDVQSKKMISDSTLMLPVYESKRGSDDGEGCLNGIKNPNDAEEMWFFVLVDGNNMTVIKIRDLVGFHFQYPGLRTLDDNGNYHTDDLSNMGLLTFENKSGDYPPIDLPTTTSP